MSNASQSDEEGEEFEEGFPLKVTIPCGIIIAVLILLAVIGNVFTIAAFVRDSKLRTVYNMYIANLAITDFLLGCISMPFYAVYTLKNYSWPFGYHFCKVYMVIDFTLCLNSVLIMIVISLDRFLLLRHGPHYEQVETKKKALLKIILSWFISFAVYSPAIIGWDHWTGEESHEEGDCDVQFAYNVPFTISTAVVEFVVPFISIATLNVLIYLNIRKRGMIHPTREKAYQRGGAGGKEEKDENKGKNKKDKKSLKAAKFLAALVVVFAVTWAPYTVTTLIISACDTCVNEHVYEFLNWVLWSKASMNPFLYAANSARFLLNFKQMLSKLKCFKFERGNNNRNDENNETVATVEG
ncbi:hypothetical protein FSP39_005365 [Pinctada imbricata]|uniref:G-protein coupled receptors family 1 profile domain-containing protein n=1 Tax=Pinctada imbricata TaxID=66713 RepID=A0AA89BYU6_PINIB|nr:hypothetical protein FSP39_005365 [Pinctada imbricata]